MHLSQPLLVELNLSARNFHLLLVGDVGGRGLFLDHFPLVWGRCLLLGKDAFGCRVIRSGVKLRVLDSLASHQLRLLHVYGG